jgi:hypothetical protein
MDGRESDSRSAGSSSFVAPRARAAASACQAGVSGTCARSQTTPSAGTSMTANAPRQVRPDW